MDRQLYTLILYKISNRISTYSKEGLNGLVLPESVFDGRAPLPDELYNSSFIDESELRDVWFALRRRHVSMISEAVRNNTAQPSK